MKKPLFRGSGCALVTPMLPDGSLHLETLDRLLDFQLQGGSDALILCGTTGEAATLSPQEQRQVLERAVARLKGKIPLIAGAGSNSTASAIALARQAQEAGADGLLVVTPYYNKATQSGLVAHFQAVADSVELPLILYNVPSRTGCNLLPQTCQILSRHPRIVGVKEASGDLSQVAELRRLCGEDFAIYSGNDDQLLPVLSLGGQGIISVAANLCPQEVHNCCQLFWEGKQQEALALQLRLLPLIHALFGEVNPIPVKEALNRLGYSAGACRPPLSPLGEAARKTLARELEALGLCKG